MNFVNIKYNVNLPKTPATKASECLYTVNMFETPVMLNANQAVWSFQWFQTWCLFYRWISGALKSTFSTLELQNMIEQTGNLFWCNQIKNLVESADAPKIGFDVARHWTWYIQAVRSYSDFHHPNPIILRWSQHNVYPVCEIFVNHQRIIWMTIPFHHHGGPAPGIRGSGSVLGSGRVFPSA